MAELAIMLSKIRSNLALIPEGRFGSIAQDPSLKDSFHYLLLCMVIAIPIDIITNLLIGNPITPILSIPFAFTIGILATYAGYLIQHLLLRLLGGRAPFLRSAQILIYAGTPGILLGGIPLLGFIASLVSLINIVRVAAHEHGISIIRAMLALVLIPFLMLAALFLLAMALGATLFGGALLLPMLKMP